MFSASTISCGKVAIVRFGLGHRGSAALSLGRIIRKFSKAARDAV